jgi:hypothetical protein
MFIGLNTIRAVSIIALLLVFASNIVTLVNDITAVNHSVEARNNSTTVSKNSSANGTANISNSDYILYVNFIIFFFTQMTDSLLGEALSRTSPQANFGPS